MFYGQRVQKWTMLREVGSSLTRLKFMRDEGRRGAISTVKEMGKPDEDPTARIDRFLEYIAVAPESMDPSGVVWKLEHILDVRDTRFKDDVKIMAPEAAFKFLKNQTLIHALSQCFDISNCGNHT